MGTLGWIVSIIGVVGVGGAIALAVFLPAVAAQVLAGAIKCFNLILSTRIGVGLLVGALALLAGELHGEYRGADRVQQAWDAAREAAAKEKEKLEKEVAQKAAEQERATIAEEQAADKKAIEDLNAYIAKINSNAAACGCKLTDDDIKWLRDN